METERLVLLQYSTLRILIFYKKCTSFVPKKRFLTGDYAPRSLRIAKRGLIEFKIFMMGGFSPITLSHHSHYKKNNITRAIAESTTDF